MEPAAAIMGSVQCIAMTHACICLLATQLACPDKRQQLVAHLSSQEVAAAFQAIFAASRHHEHLLLTAVSKAVPNNQQVLTDVLLAPAAALLGEWVQPWQQAFRSVPTRT